MAHLEGTYEQINHRLGGMEARLDRIDSRIDRVDSRLDRVEQKIDELIKRFDAKIDSRFMWTVGIVVASILPLYFRH